MSGDLYAIILEKKKQGQKLFAVLIDPDKFQSNDVIRMDETAKVDIIMVGGSLLSTGNF